MPRPILDRKSTPGWSRRAGAFKGPLSPGKDGPADMRSLGELGRGGMGVVYKARHRRLNRLVALKMIRGAYVDEIQIARFKIEAEAVATLRHPNILQIYDIGEFNGSPYVALELLEGGSLFDKLRATLLPPRQAAEWMVPAGPGDGRRPQGGHRASRPETSQHPVQLPTAFPRSPTSASPSGWRRTRDKRTRAR